jgi:peptidoglycan/xylan/chitin deacetylase (PgdA/CDA1 family)
MAERLRSIPEVRRRGLWLLQYQLAIVRFREALRSAKSWKALNAEFGMRLPVLMYHHVGPQRPGTYPGLTVSPRRFERQVRWLASRGYAGISPTDWLRWRREGKSLPEKPVLLTFDDAYSDIADYALPVLRQHRFGASVFVVTSQVGGTNTWDEARGSGPHRVMTADQIRYWAAQGIEFGAHGRTHADLTKLTGAELAEEVAGSANDLASILRSRVSSFAYPYGSQNQTVRDCVRSVFDLAFSTAEGLNSLQTDPLSLRRTMIGNGDTPMDLECRLRWGWSPMQRLRARARLRSRLQRAANLVYGGNG